MPGKIRSAPTYQPSAIYATSTASLLFLSSTFNDAVVLQILSVPLMMTVGCGCSISRQELSCSFDMPICQ